MDTSPSAPFRDALDIVFADRNRAYGAYQLRRSYPRYLLRALVAGILLIGFGIALPHLVGAIQAMVPAPPLTEVVIDMGPPPDIVTTPPPPPPPPVPTPPPPPRSMNRFVPPVVLEDQKADEQDRQAIEELVEDKKDIGTKNVEVKEETEPVIDPNPEGLRVIEAPPPPKVEETYDIFNVNKPPTFPGGERDLLKFLSENIKYPALARENNIQGKVALSFVIAKDGSVTDVQILKDIGGGCGKEAIRVVNSMPKWSPGEANGYPVKVRYTLPVDFRLQ